jgi:hypothetical protein
MERKGVISLPQEGGTLMRYFYHLSFGDRTCRDEEGFEFPNRLAAQAEARAVIRELSHREAPRRWAGWFLQVADEEGEFVRLPLGHPALVVVSGSASPHSELTTEEVADGRLARAADEMWALRQEMRSLRKRIEQVRQNLAWEGNRAVRLKVQAHGLVSMSRMVRSF